MRLPAQAAERGVDLIDVSSGGEHILASGQADAVLLARAAQRDPHWWLRAGVELGAPQDWVPQYQRAYTRRSF